MCAQSTAWHGKHDVSGPLANYVRIRCDPGRQAAMQRPRFPPLFYGVASPSASPCRRLQMSVLRFRSCQTTFSRAPHSPTRRWRSDPALQRHGSVRPVPQGGAVMSFQPREWQKDCLKHFLRKIERGETSFVLEACMGAGESAFAAWIAKTLLGERGRRSRSHPCTRSQAFNPR